MKQVKNFTSGADEVKSRILEMCRENTKPSLIAKALKVPVANVYKIMRGAGLKWQEFKITPQHVAQTRYFLGLGHSSPEMVGLVGLSRSSIDRLTSDIGITPKDVATYKKFKIADGLMAKGLGLLEACELAQISTSGFYAYEKLSDDRKLEIEKLIDTAEEKRVVDSIANMILRGNVILNDAYVIICNEYNFAKKPENEFYVKIKFAINGIEAPRIEAKLDKIIPMLEAGQDVGNIAAQFNLNAAFLQKYLRDKGIIQCR